MITAVPTKNKTNIQDINNSLLSIVNSEYLDGADAIVGVPLLQDDGSITFRFRGDSQIYDATITADEYLTYVESTLRSDSYLEGYYLPTLVPLIMSKGYVSGMMTTRVRSDTKTKRCKKGKPCGNTCIPSGQKCNRELSHELRTAAKGARNSLRTRAVLGLGGLAVASAAGAIALNALQKKEKVLGIPTSIPTNSVSAPATSKTRISKKRAALVTGGIAAASVATAGGIAAKRFMDEPIPLQQAKPQEFKLSRTVPERTSDLEDPWNSPVSVSSTIKKKTPTSTSSGTPLLTGTVSPPPVLSPSSTNRPSPLQVEVIATRPATPEEIESFQTRERKTNQTALSPSLGIITPDPRSRARFSGVNNAVKIKGFDEDATSRLQNVLNHIDKVVKISNLHPVSLKPIAATDSLAHEAAGVYNLTNYFDSNNKVIDRIPDAIRINTTSRAASTPELTVVHELAHFLDHAAIGNTKTGFGSKLDQNSTNPEGLLHEPVMNDFFKVMDTNPTIARLNKQLVTSKVEERRNKARYLLSKNEIFARAFTQYIVNKSKSGVLKAQLKAEAALEKDKFWPDKEFKKIEPVMDKMFKELGWQ